MGELIGLIVAGSIVGALGRLAHRGRGAVAWPATIAVGVGAVVSVGLLLGDLGFPGYLVAAIAAGILVVVVGRVWPAARA